MNLIELPDLALLHIASNFSIQERAALRLVSKRLKWLVDHLFVQEKLYLFQHPPYSFIDHLQQQWPCGAPVKREHSIRLKICGKEELKYNPQSCVDLSPCHSEHHFDLKAEFLSGLKCLYLMSIRFCDQSFVQAINCLRQLRVLVIDSCDHRRCFNFMKFDLPLLKVLHLEGMSYELLELNTPSLEEFRLIQFSALEQSSEDQIDFKHPESLRILMCTYFEWELEFANLEVLVSLTKLPDDFDLRKLPKLRRLEVYPTVYSEATHANMLRATRGLLLQSYYRMLSQKRLALNSNLEIRLFGFEEELFQNSKIDLKFGNREIDPSHPYFSIDARYAQVLAKNYAHLISPMPYLVEVNFSSLINCFLNQIPDDFFVKFPLIRSVHVQTAQLIDCSPLIPFLKNAKRLMILTIERPEQKIVDQLPTIESITYLKLLVPPEKLNFLAQMKRLQALKLVGVSKSCIGSIPIFTETIWNCLECLRKLVIRKSENLGDNRLLIYLGPDKPDKLRISKISNGFSISERRYHTREQNAENLDKLLKILKSKEYFLNEFLA